MARLCPMCNGSGLTCDACGEAERACRCDGGPGCSVCADCDGAGTVPADREPDPRPVGKLVTTPAHALKAV